MKNKIYTLFASTLSIVLLFALASFAKATVSSPSFPSCAEQTAKGDWVTAEYGFHHIPGQEETIEGSDDVYYLEGGNFLQCLCPVEGEEGVQTNWWRIGELSQGVIENFVNLGWFLLDGGAWNLLHEPYLVQNADYICHEPEPTPTVIPTQTPTPTATPTVVPTETPAPTSTPVPGDEPESYCSGLSVSPSEGTAPLTVKFNASGYDEDGDIKRYKFDFGDDSDDQPQVWEQDGPDAFHRYQYPGTYAVALHVKDSRGNWRNGNENCKKEIKVYSEPQVLAASVSKGLPETGTSALVGLALLLTGPVGAYLFRRFKLAS